MKTFRPTSPEEMIACGTTIASMLQMPMIVELHGELGAGKTTLAKGIISALTGTPCHEITSPTFQYVAFYEGNNVRVSHFDLWRLTDATAFFQMGLDEFLTQGICLIEWPERIHQVLPPATMRISIEIASRGRLINITSKGISCLS